MASETNDPTDRRAALWRREVASFLHRGARLLPWMRREPGTDDDPVLTTIATFPPEFIAPYEEVIRHVAVIDARPYQPGDHWTQVLERLQAVADRPYDAFEYHDDLWIQRTPDIEEPLIVSGRPGDRRFTLVTSTRDFEWSGTDWEGLA